MVPVLSASLLFSTSLWRVPDPWTAVVDYTAHGVQFFFDKYIFVLTTSNTAHGHTKQERGYGG